MTNFWYAPVGSEQLEGKFIVKGDEVTEDDLAAVAGIINTAVETSGRSVWMNPEKDSKGVRVNGTPVEIGGRAVLYTAPSDFAVFPLPHNNPER